MRIVVRLLPRLVGVLLAYASLFLPWQFVRVADDSSIAADILFGELGAWGIAYLLGVLVLVGATVSGAVAQGRTRSRLRFVGIVGLIAAVAALVVLTTRERFLGLDPPPTDPILTFVGGSSPELITGPALYVAWAAVATLGVVLAVGHGPTASWPPGTASPTRSLVAVYAGLLGTGLAVASTLVPWQQVTVLAEPFDFESFAHTRLVMMSLTDQRYWALGYLLGLATVVVALVAVGMSRASDARAYGLAVAAFSAGIAVLAVTVAVHSNWGWNLADLDQSPSGQLPAVGPVPSLVVSWRMPLMMNVTATAGGYLACAGAALLGVASLLLPGRGSLGLRRVFLGERHS